MFGGCRNKVLYHKVFVISPTEYMFSKNMPQTAADTALSYALDRDLRIQCYCKENVWRLVHQMLCSGGGGCGNGDYNDGN